MSDDGVEEKKVEEGKKVEEKEEEFGQEETDIPSPLDNDRSCRDILCLLIFLMCWVLWILLAAMAFTDGCPDNCNDPKKLVYGFDSAGCMCGKHCEDLNIDNRGKKRLYIPDPQQPETRVCLKDCPGSFAFDKDMATDLGTYVCDQACRNADQNEEGVEEFFLQRSRGAALSAGGNADNCFIPGSKSGDCWYPAYPTTEILFKCLPSLPTNLTTEDVETMEALGLPVDTGAFSSALAVLSNPGGEYGKMTAEFSNSWPLVVFALLMSVLLGFVFLVLIRFFAMPMMWFFIIGLLFALSVCTLFAWDRTGALDLFKSQVSESTGQNISALVEASGADDYSPSVEPAVVYAGAVLLSIATGLYVVLLCFFAKRIAIAVRVIQEAAKALGAMPTLVLQPVVTFLVLFLLYSWAAIISVYLASAGEFDPTTGTFTYGGGNCREDMNGSVIAVAQSASLITLALPSGVFLRRGEFSLDGMATWTALSGALTLAHPAMAGGDCRWDRTLQTDRCKTNTNTTSSLSFAVGGCLGNLQSEPCVPGEVSDLVSSSAAGQSEVVWNATLGFISFDITPSEILNGTYMFAANIDRCDTAAGTCAEWDVENEVWDCGALGVNQSFPDNCVALPFNFTLVTTMFTSSYTVSNGEAVRSCNLYSNKETATEKLKASAMKMLETQGKVDVNELEKTPWSTAPTIENWRGFIPITFDGNTYNSFVLYHLFMFLWVNQFTISSGYYIVAGAVAGWYWTFDKVAVFPTYHARAIWRYVRYNLGTVAFGSMIIAIVQMIRIVFNYFVNKADQFKDNQVVKAVVCLVNCCLWCLEKVLGYINKNAYIMSATHGLGFCKAAWRGFMLLMRNLLRVAAVNAVAVAILFFGQLFIVFLSLALTYMVATSYAQSLELSDGAPFLTLFIIFLMNWFVADSFMDTFSAAVDTVFLSFLHDSEVNNGSTDKPYFMADSLRRAIGVSNKSSKVAPADVEED